MYGSAMRGVLRPTSRVFCGICGDERRNTMGCFVAANVATCAVFCCGCERCCLFWRVLQRRAPQYAGGFLRRQMPLRVLFRSRTPRIAANAATCDGVFAARAAFCEVIVERRAPPFVDVEEARAATSWTICLAQNAATRRENSVGGARRVLR